MQQVKQAIEHDIMKAEANVNGVISSLPIRLQKKLKSDIYDDCLLQIKFFKEVAKTWNNQFIVWVSYRVTLNVIPPTNYVYEETDEAGSMYFVRQGSLAFVVSNAKNAVFHELHENTMFGFEDYVFAALLKSMQIK